jgi:hypothetical protein
MTTDNHPGLTAQLTDVQSKLDRIFELLASPKETRACYTVEEVAKMICKSDFTVRQWCNQGRINAKKGEERRGGATRWRISSAEIHRYKEEGLMPMDLARNLEG